MEDRLLSGLKLAEVYWKKAPFAKREEKVAMAEALNYYEMFSLTQLAKIVDLNPRDLSGKLKPSAGGGRFDPQTLGTLVMLREHRLKGSKPSTGLVALTREAGNSLSCTCALTGIPYTTYYNQLVNERKQ